MPLMRPEVQAILRKVGLDKDSAAEPGSLAEKLSAAGLGLETVLENLAEVANGSGNEALRLSATRDALKMHGALKEQPTGGQMPSFTIIINDKSGADSVQVQGENPIFLPRQLLATLDKTN